MPVKPFGISPEESPGLLCPGPELASQALPSAFAVVAATRAEAAAGRLRPRMVQVLLLLSTRLEQEVRAASLSPSLLPSLCEARCHFA